MVAKSGKRGPPPVPWIPPAHIPIAPYEPPAPPPPPEEEEVNDKLVEDAKTAPLSPQAKPLAISPSNNPSVFVTQKNANSPSFLGPTDSEAVSPSKSPMLNSHVPSYIPDHQQQLIGQIHASSSPSIVPRTSPFINATLTAPLPLSVLPSPTGKESLTSTSEILTSLSLLYDWRIPMATTTLAQEEKLVSPPFGAFKETYQLVLFPRGVGEGEGTHMSIFLRPVKSDLENESPNWYRPISQFSIHVLGADGTLENPQCLLSETSGSDFPGFSEQISGWGFNQFLPLDSLSPGFIHHQTDTLTLQCEVLWPRTDMLYSVQQSIHLGSPSCLASDFPAGWTSMDFGSLGILWNLKTRITSAKEIGFFLVQSPSMSANPTTSLPGETSLPEFKIASLSIKLFSGPSLVSTKTLTGGYHFTGLARECGWDSFYSLGSLDPRQSLMVSIQLDYLDPASHVSLTKNTALHSDLESLKQSKVNLETLLKGNEKARLDLESKLKAKSETCQKLKGTLESVRTDMADLLDKQAQVLTYQEKLVTVKKKLSGLFGRMVSEDVTPHSLDDPESLEDKIRVLEAKLGESRIKNSELESELVRLQSASLRETKDELDSRFETALRSPSPYSDNSGTLQDALPSLSECMAKVREEIAESQLALQDARLKTPLCLPPPGLPLDLENEVELTGISADLIIRLAELEVARASLYSVINSHPYDSFPPDLESLKVDLRNVRQTLFDMMQTVNTDSQVRPGPGLGEQFNSGLFHGSQASFDNQQQPYNQPFGYDQGYQQLDHHGQWNNHRAPSPTQVVDEMNEMKHVLYQVKEMIQSEPSRLEEVVKNVMPTVTGSSGIAGGLVEPWTPAAEPITWSQRGDQDSSPSGLTDNPELMKLLKQLEKAQKQSRRPALLSLFVIFSTLFTLLFSFYASAHVLCSPQFESKFHFSNPVFSSPVRDRFCHGIVLPAWTGLAGAWHSSAEYLVMDVVPQMFDIASTSKRAFKATAKNIKLMAREWQEEKRRKKEAAAAAAELEMKIRAEEAAELARKREAEEAERAKRRQLEEAELKRKKMLEEAQQAKIRQEEEVERVRKAEEEIRAAEAAEAARKQAADIARRRAEEVAWKAAEEAARKQEEDIARKLAEEAAQRQEEEVARIQAESSRKQAEEAARVRAKEAARKHAEEIETLRKTQEAADLEKRRSEEAERIRQQDEADALAMTKQVQEEQERRAREAIAESQRVAFEAERERISQEELKNAEETLIQAQQTNAPPPLSERLYDGLSIRNSDPSSSFPFNTLASSSFSSIVSEATSASILSESLLEDSSSSSVSSTSEYSFYTGNPSDVSSAPDPTQTGQPSRGPPPRLRHLRHKGKPEPPVTDQNSTPLQEESSSSSIVPAADPVVVESSSSDGARPFITTSTSTDPAPVSEDSMVPIQADDSFLSSDTTRPNQDDVNNVLDDDPMIENDQDLETFEEVKTEL